MKNDERERTIYRYSHPKIANHTNDKISMLSSFLTYCGSHPHKTSHIGSHSNRTRRSSSNRTGASLVHDFLKGRWSLDDSSLGLGSCFTHDR